MVKVNYSTNSSKGVGSIAPYAVSTNTAAAQSGTLIEGAKSVTTSGGTTTRSLTYTPNTPLTGYLQLYVTCTTNSIYIHSVDITYEDVPNGPEITVTPTSLTGFNYIVGSGPSAEQSFDVSGSNLTDDITVTAPLNYEVATTAGSDFASEVTLPLSGGTVYTRMIAGLLEGNYGGNITLTSSGATNVNVEVSGEVTAIPLATPLASAATNITSDSFSANWNSVTGSTSYEVDVYTLVGSPITDLIISEYVEGSGNNKALELYNGTGATIDLSKYSILKQSNGVGDYIDDLILSGNLLNGETYVIVNNSASAALKEKANLLVGNTPINFNGNDAVALFKSGTQIDEVGVKNQTTNWGTDLTLRRKSTIDSPIIPYNIADWDQFASDTFDGLGSHTANTITTTLVSSQDVGNVTSYEVTGLNPETQYFYVVRAKAGAVTSPNSNEIQVTTKSDKTTYTAGAWDNGQPTVDLDAIIADNYNEESFTSKSLKINEGFTLTVPSNGFIETGKVTNEGNIVVADNANFVQTGLFTAGTGSSFKVNRTSKDVSRLDYIAWSSPMENSTQTLVDFSPLTVSTRYLTYNAGAFVKLTNPNVAFTLGQGYLIRTPNNFNDFPSVQKFNGVFEGTKPNSGPVSYDPSGITGEFVFLGNPYPSAISMQSFYDANPQIDGSFYIWNSAAAKMDNDGKYSGSNYVTYTSAGSVPEGSAPFVPVAQGFFINRGTSNALLNFNDGMRQTTEKGTFAKTSVTDKFWLQMTAPSGTKPQMLIGFNENATSGYDQGLDAKMLDSNADVIYSTVDGKSLIINALGSFSTADVINVTANFLAAGNYKMSIAKKEGIFSNGQEIYVKDNVTGVETELTAGDYSFAATAGLQADRFTLYFNKGVLAGSNVTKGQSTIYADHQIVHVKGSSKIASVEVYDLSGKLMKTTKNVNSDSTSLTVSYKGIAVVKLILGNGEVVTKKIILK